MALTRINALVSGFDTRVELRNHEVAQPSLIAGPFSAVSCPGWAIPWCSSTERFNDGHYLALSFVFPDSRSFSYWIWQESIDGLDAVRYSSTPGYFRPDDPRTPSRRLASGRAGPESVVTGDSENILFVDERPWVVLYRVGV